MDKNLPPVLTKKDLMEILRVSNKTIQVYLNRETDPLPCIRISCNTVRILRDEFFIWLSRQVPVEK